MATFHFENSIKEKYFNNQNAIIAGCDEVGRGCLAGPLVAACAVLHKNTPSSLLQEITDSKKLTKKKRESLEAQIKQHAYFSITEVNIATIDSINILQASLQGMRLAYENLAKEIKIDALIIDGNQNIKVDVSSYTLINGDSLSLNIAAASILAKVHRDNLMTKLSNMYPEYLWHKNAGYGTKEHLNALVQYGITPYHRKSFAPVKKLLI